MLARACVVIPMYNEATVIGDVVRTVRERFARVVCVDDGSADESAASPALPEPKSYDTGSTSAREPPSRPASGGRCATRRPSTSSRSTPTAALGRGCGVDGVDCAGFGVQVVLGSRFLGDMKGSQPGTEEPAQDGVHFTRATTGMQLTDAHNGLRVLRRDAAERLSFRLHGMSHASEVLSVIAKHGWTYVEHPTTVTYTDVLAGQGSARLQRAQHRLRPRPQPAAGRVVIIKLLLVAGLAAAASCCCAASAAPWVC